jgi:polysaccharide biosynthesis/export protein
MRTLIAILLLASLAIGCRTRGPEFNPRAAEPEGAFTAVTLSNRVSSDFLKPPLDPYRLGPGDVIEVESIGETAGRSTLVIGPDGKVYYSLLPGVSLWGLTIPQARETLQAQMAKFTRATPELVLNLRVPASQRVWLLGAVQSPGVYTLAAPTTLLDALGAVGGVPANRLDDLADLSRSFVLRDGKLLPVDFDRLLKHGDMSQNLYLKAGDFVYLRPSELPSFSVLGAVQGPRVLPYSRELTLATAVIACGGTAKFAQDYRIAVVRGGLTDPKIALVSYSAIVKGKVPDFPLAPGDIVYVPYAPYRHVAQLAEDMLDNFVRTVAINEGSALAGEDRPAQLTAPVGRIIVSPSP